MFEDLATKIFLTYSIALAVISGAIGFVIGALIF